MNRQIIFFCTCICMISGLCAQQVAREEVYVHTDRNYYHSGETMWFRMFVVDANSKKFSKISSVAYLELLDSASRPVVRGMVILDKGKGTGTIEIQVQHAGVYTLIAYTSWMKNFPASEYFQMPVAVVNGLESPVNFVPTGVANLKKINSGIGLKTKDTQYNTRSVVSIELNATDSSNSLPREMSISVFKVDEPSSAGAFAAFGIPGAESVVYETVDTESVVTHEMVKSDVIHLAEHNGRIVTGRVTDKKSGEPIKGAYIFLTAVGTPGGFYNDVSNDAGRFLIEARDLERCDSMIIRCANADSLYNITVHSPFQTGFEVTATNKFTSITKDSLALIEKSINTQVQETYYDDPPKQDGSLDTNLFFGLPDYSYLLDDFTRFSKMEEVFREYVAPVAVNRRAGISSLRIYVPGEHATYERAPLVLLDGYPVLNIDELFLFDPLKVKKLDVVTRRFFRNGIVYDGLIYLTTYNGNMNAYPVDRHATIIKDQIVLPDAKFIAPRYESVVQKESRLPDFRTLLYWSPLIEGPHIEFYTSDVVGTFVALVRGVNNKGEVVSGWTTFKVAKY